MFLRELPSFYKSLPEKELKKLLMLAENQVHKKLKNREEKTIGKNTKR